MNGTIDFGLGDDFRDAGLMGLVLLLVKVVIVIVELTQKRMDYSGCLDRHHIGRGC